MYTWFSKADKRDKKQNKRQVQLPGDIHFTLNAVLQNPPLDGTLAKRSQRTREKAAAKI